MGRPTLITIQGNYLKLDGTPEKGTIYFRSKVYALSSSDATVVVPSILKANLDPTDGSVNLQVPATNDPAWSPEGWTYEVHLRLSDSVTTFNVMVPYDMPGGILELSELLPTVSANGNLYAPYNHTHEGGGSGANPATTVVSETAYGQSSAVGTGTTYARADHTHGTPALPTAAGIGAAAASHTHAAADLASGTLAIARIPTGTSGTTVALGNDSRFNDARTPTSHASSHASAGSDPVTISQSQVTGLASALNAKQDAGSYAAATHTHTESDITGLVSDLAAKAPLASPTFTGTVSGITKSMVGLGNVDNTADTNKPISTATQTALDAKTDVLVLNSSDPVPGGTRTGTVIVRLA